MRTTGVRMSEHRVAEQVVALQSPKLLGRRATATSVARRVGSSRRRSSFALGLGVLVLCLPVYDAVATGSSGTLTPAQDPRAAGGSATRVVHALGVMPPQTRSRLRARPGAARAEPPPRAHILLCLLAQKFIDDLKAGTITEADAIKRLRQSPSLAIERDAVRQQRIESPWALRALLVAHSIRSERAE